MCFLAYIPAGQSIPYEFLLNAEDQNQDGAGFAVADGKNIIIEKGANLSAYSLAAKLDTWKGHPAIVHFRWGTNGSVVDENCHPFILPKKWAAAHNGIIEIPTEGDESDTRSFLRQKIKPVIRRGMCLTNKRIVETIGNVIGSHNKMVFLHGSGKYSIANEESGHWVKGIWASNYAYVGWPKSYKRSYIPSKLLKYDITELSCKLCGRQVEDEFYVDKDDGTVSCAICETLAEYY